MILINVARGIVVDLDVLVVCLEVNSLCGVVIDVFFVEFVFINDLFELLLCKFDNVILILYIGGLMVEV